MKENAPHSEALVAAQRIVDLLRPHCVRIEISGSIRRKKPVVGDIEIVMIPKPYEVGLFASGICKELSEWVTVKGDFPCKHTQRIDPVSDMKVDFFTAEEGNWGLIMAIRTGSAKYSHEVLANGWSSAGFFSEKGWLHRKSDLKPVAVPEEQDLFRIIGLEYTLPENRNYE